MSRTYRRPALCVEYRNADLYATRRRGWWGYYVPRDEEECREEFARWGRDGCDGMTESGRSQWFTELCNTRKRARNRNLCRKALFDHIDVENVCFADDKDCKSFFWTVW